MKIQCSGARPVIAEHLPAPVGEGEKRVVQYSPEWLAHVTAGGDVRDGNILVGVTE